MLPFERAAHAPGMVVTPHCRDLRQRRHQTADHDIAVLLAPFECERKLVARSRAKAELEQHALVADVLRIRQRAVGRADVKAAHVLGLMRLGAGIADQRFRRFAAPCAEQRVGQRIAGTVVADAVAAAGTLVLLQQIGRVEREEADHATDRIRSVQAGRRAAQDFDALEEIERCGHRRVHREIGRAATVVEIGQAHAIDHLRHPVILDATNVDPGSAEAANVARERHVGLIAQQVGLVGWQAAFDLLAADHSDGSRHFVGRRFGARGCDGDGG